MGMPSARSGPIEGERAALKSHCARGPRGRFCALAGMNALQELQWEKSCGDGPPSPHRGFGGQPSRAAGLPAESRPRGVQVEGERRLASPTGQADVWTTPINAPVLRVT